jgi:hypothetical protein
MAAAVRVMATTHVRTPDRRSARRPGRTGES